MKHDEMLEGGAAVFTAKVRYDATHPDALAMYCSDGRFTEPVEELLRHLGHDRLDTLTMPGGPGLLDLFTGGVFDTETAKRAAGFLIEGHALRRVVLVSHQGCGYYRARMPNELPERVVARQLEDLAAAAKVLARAHPRVSVDAFFARAAEGRVRFDPVPIGA